MATRFLNESTGVKSGEFGESQAQPRDSRRTPRSRRIRGLLVAATMSSMLVPSSGCMLVNGMQRALTRHDSCDEFMLNYRNRAWAARAWLCQQDRYANHCYVADLEAGFRQGYEDVAAGGNGCLPAVCPQSYWGWQYQSADGQARMNAWFEGYPLGVKAAEQDGVGHWGNIAAAFPIQQPAPVVVAPPVAGGESVKGSEAVSEELAAPVPLPELSAPKAAAPMIEPGGINGSLPEIGSPDEAGLPAGLPGF